MPEYIVCALGIGVAVGGYQMVTTGTDITRKPPLFYLGWSLIILGSMVAQAAVFYAMWR